MIKKIILPLFVLTMAIIVYLMATETIERTVFFQQKIMSIDEDPFVKKSLSHLTPEDVSKLKLTYKSELAQLDYVKSSAIVFIFVCGVSLMAIIAVKPIFSVEKFDAIALMIAYVLMVCTILAIFQVFIGGQFEDGHNATIGLRISIEITLLLITPLLFFAAMKINQVEIEKKMHQQKWITHVAMVLAVVSGLTVLAMGIAVLSTPDVSTFTS